MQNNPLIKPKLYPEKACNSLPITKEDTQLCYSWVSSETENSARIYSTEPSMYWFDR